MEKLLQNVFLKVSQGKGGSPENITKRKDLTFVRDQSRVEKVSTTKVNAITSTRKKTADKKTNPSKRKSVDKKTTTKKKNTDKQTTSKESKKRADTKKTASKKSTSKKTTGIKKKVEKKTTDVKKNVQKKTTGSKNSKAAGKNADRKLETDVNDSNEDADSSGSSCYSVALGGRCCSNCSRENIDQFFRDAESRKDSGFPDFTPLRKD